VHQRLIRARVASPIHTTPGQPTGSVPVPSATTAIGRAGAKRWGGDQGSSRNATSSASARTAWATRATPWGSAATGLARRDHCEPAGPEEARPRSSRRSVSRSPNSEPTRRCSRPEWSGAPGPCFSTRARRSMPRERASRVSRRCRMRSRLPAVSTCPGWFSPVLRRSDCTRPDPIRAPDGAAHRRLSSRPTSPLFPTTSPVISICCSPPRPSATEGLSTRSSPVPPTSPRTLLPACEIVSTARQCPFSRRRSLRASTRRCATGGRLRPDPQHPVPASACVGRQCCGERAESGGTHAGPI
jgi:hypothetical protein